MTRFIQLTCLFAVLACVTAGSASALAFADQDYVWPDGTVGEAYFKQLIGRIDLGPCTGTKCKYTLLAGELPPGLELHSLGIVDGTPTQLGTWSFWLQLHDCCGQTAEREFTLKITRIRLVVTTGTLPVAIRNAPYSQALATNGGAGAKRWSLASGSLPAGLTLNGGGTITGTPTATGDAVFTVKVADDGPSTDSKQLLLRVVDPLVIAPLATRARVAEVGRAFSSTLAGTGGTQPYRWSVTGTLPAGLTLDGATGVVSGTPDSPGSAPLSITVTDANGLATTVAVSFVVAAPLTIATVRLPALAVARAYSAKLAVRGGVRPLSWRIVGGHLPRGIRLGTGTGTLSGSTAGAGTFRFRVRVTDFLGAVSTRPFVLSVGA